MTLIDENSVQESIEQLYLEEVLPIAISKLEQGQEVFPLGPDANCQTYYEPRLRPEMIRRDFTALSYDPFELEQSLISHWRGLGHTELINMVPRICALSLAAKKTMDNNNGKKALPSDLYVLY